MASLGIQKTLVSTAFFNVKSAVTRPPCLASVEACSCLLRFNGSAAAWPRRRC